MTPQQLYLLYNSPRVQDVSIDDYRVGQTDLLRIYNEVGDGQ